MSASDDISIFTCRGRPSSPSRTAILHRMASSVPASAGATSVVCMRISSGTSRAYVTRNPPCVDGSRSDRSGASKKSSSAVDDSTTDASAAILFGCCCCNCCGCGCS